GAARLQRELLGDRQPVHERARRPGDQRAQITQRTGGPAPGLRAHQESHPELLVPVQVPIVVFDEHQRAYGAPAPVRQHGQPRIADHVLGALRRRGEHRRIDLGVTDTDRHGHLLTADCELRRHGLTSHCLVTASAELPPRTGRSRARSFPEEPLTRGAILLVTADTVGTIIPATSNDAASLSVTLSLNITTVMRNSNESVTFTVTDGVRTGRPWQRRLHTAPC